VTLEKKWKQFVYYNLQKTSCENNSSNIGEITSKSHIALVEKVWIPLFICPRGKEKYGRCGFPDTIYFILW
jgi:hypothetical protein